MSVFGLFWFEWFGLGWFELLCFVVYFGCCVCSFVGFVLVLLGFTGCGGLLGLGVGVGVVCGGLC